jgi:hypothetical protein
LAILKIPRLSLDLPSEEHRHDRWRKPITSAYWLSLSVKFLSITLKVTVPTHIFERQLDAQNCNCLGWLGGHCREIFPLYISNRHFSWFC